MTKKEALAQARRDLLLDNPAGGVVIVHRGVRGNHNMASLECWCCPLVVHEADPRSDDELLRASEKVN